MGFSISEAPARIASFSGKEQSVRKDNDDGAALPPRLVSFVLVLAMDASNHEQELAALFPGIDFLIRAMAAAEDDAPPPPPEAPKESPPAELKPSEGRRCTKLQGCCEGEKGAHSGSAETRPGAMTRAACDSPSMAAAKAGWYLNRLTAPRLSVKPAAAAADETACAAAAAALSALAGAACGGRGCGS